MTLPLGPWRGVLDMIVLLAAGIGVGVAGLLAIGFGIPISDSSFGNALMIGGVVVLCTGLILVGMSFVVRELAKLVAAQATVAVTPLAAPRPVEANPLAAPIDPAREVPDRDSGPASPAPWADENAARAVPRPPSPEPPSIEPVEPAPPPVPDRPARRNLLFATRRRDKAELDQPTAPPPPTALEAAPRASFENAWPNPSPTNGIADGTAPSGAAVEPVNHQAAASRPSAAEQAASDAAKPPGADLPPGVTVVRSGTVDEMAYTYYSDGSIEAQLPGESPIRFASLDELRTYVEQRK